jgi:hypothetical protein
MADSENRAFLWYSRRVLGSFWGGREKMKNGDFERKFGS